MSARVSNRISQRKDHVDSYRREDNKNYAKFLAEVRAAFTIEDDSDESYSDQNQEFGSNSARWWP